MQTNKTLAETESATSALLPLVTAVTSLTAARAAHKWFHRRSILSKITRDGVTTIEVCVPHPSPSGVGATQEALIESTRKALADLLPDGTEIRVLR